jgi:hypothetical protein
MSRFANLAAKAENKLEPAQTELVTNPSTAPSRIGLKAISGYFSPELSMALPLRPQTRPQPASTRGRGVQRCAAQIR